MARVEGAPRGSHAHTYLYTAHGTRHMAHGTWHTALSMQCVCVDGGVGMGVGGGGWAMWGRALILPHWAWGGGHAQQTSCDGEYSGPVTEGHRAMCQAVDRKGGSTAGQQGSRGISTAAVYGPLYAHERAVQAKEALEHNKRGRWHGGWGCASRATPCVCEDVYVRGCIGCPMPVLDPWCWLAMLPRGCH